MRQRPPAFRAWRWRRPAAVLTPRLIHGTTVCGWTAMVLAAWDKDKNSLYDAWSLSTLLFFQETHEPLRTVERTLRRAPRSNVEHIKANCSHVDK